VGRLVPKNGPLPDGPPSSQRKTSRDLMKFEDFNDFYWTFGIIEVRSGWFLKMDLPLGPPSS